MVGCQQQLVLHDLDCWCHPAYCLPVPHRVRLDDQGMSGATFGGYVAATRETAIYKDALSGSLDAITYTVLGLAGEAGEVANTYKKVLRDDDSDITPEREEQMRGELGDVLWYVARISDEMGWDLEAIARAN